MRTLWNIMTGVSVLLLIAALFETYRYITTNEETVVENRTESIIVAAGTSLIFLALTIAFWYIGRKK